MEKFNASVFLVSTPESAFLSILYQRHLCRYRATFVKTIEKKAYIHLDVERLCNCYCIQKNGIK